MTPHAIRVFDDVLSDPELYRAGALALTFHDLTPSPAVTFHGMADIGTSPLSALLLAEFGLTTTWEGFRLSPEGQEEPNYIHTDVDMGEWSGIFYLHPAPPEGDGTVFYRSKHTGEIQSVATDPQERMGEWLAWKDRDRWEPWHTVAARFNRLLLFPAPYFHSRAIVENYGTGDDARLVQILFGRGVLPCQ